MAIEQLFGRKVTATSSVVLWQIGWGALFLFCLVEAVLSGTIERAAIILFPLAWLIALTVYRPKKFEAEFTELEIITSEGLAIPYLSIQGIKLNDKTPNPLNSTLRPGKIVLFHDKGVLIIPKKSEPPILDVYRFLWQFVSFPALHPPIPELASWYSEHVTMYGSTNVATFISRHSRGYFNLGPAFRLGSILSALVGVLWVLLSENPGQPGSLTVYGIILIAGGVLGFGVSFARGTGARRLTDPKSMLIVSPGGLALKEGALQGTMQWKELLNVQLKSTRRTFRYSGTPTGIRLKVAGAEIMIQDIYDRPLSFIFDLIQRNRTSSSGLLV